MEVLGISEDQRRPRIRPTSLIKTRWERPGSPSMI